MEFWSKLGSWGKNQLIYYTGREVLGFAVLPLLFTSVLSGLAPGIGTWVAFAVALAATVPLQFYIGWRKQAAVENRMLKDYKNEIAAQVGIPEHEVTREHLHQVADGDLEKGVLPNQVIAQARDRAGTRQTVRQLLVSASAVATFGLFFALVGTPFMDGAVEAIGSWAERGIEKVLGIEWPVDRQVLTAMLFSGMGLSMVNTALDYASNLLFGLNRKTAHDQILEIRHDMARDKEVTREQVFGVFVAINPGLDALIEGIYGKPYYNLDPAVQTEAMTVYGREYSRVNRQHRNIEGLTADINDKRIEADELAFAVFGRYSGVPKQEAKPAKEESVQEVEQAQEVMRSPRPVEREPEIPEAGQETSSGKPAVFWAKQVRAGAAANDNVHGFAQRFEPRKTEPETQRTKQSTFAERERTRDMTRDGPDPMVR